MIRSGRFSFDKIQVTTDNKFSKIGVMGIHQVFETLVRVSKALKVSYVSEQHTVDYFNNLIFN